MPTIVGPGVPMIGSYMNVMLYTLEIFVAYIYYFASPRSSKDPILVKFFVATCLVSDTIGTIGVCSQCFITHLIFTDTITPMKLFWSFEMLTVGNVFSILIFQCYMIRRLWMLFHNYVLCTFIALLMLLTFGSGMALIATGLDIITKWVFEGPQSHPKWITPLILCLASAMVTDVFIMIALVWQINRPELLWNLQTKRLVRRISSLAIKTGVVPCVYALIQLVTYVSNTNLNIVSFLTYMLGRVYTLSMFYSLLYRDKLFSDDHQLMNMTRNSHLPSSITVTVSKVQSTHPESWDDGI